MVLVELGEDGGDLALAEGVVERVVDGRTCAMPRREAVSRSMTSSVSRPLILLSLATSVSVGSACATRSTSWWVQVVELGRVGVFKRVLVLRAADAIVDGEVLQRLQVERDAVDLVQLGLQALDDLRGASRVRCVSGLRLIWMRPLLRVVLVPSMPMKEERLSTAGSLRMTSASFCWRSVMLAKRDGLRRLGDAEDDAGVLHREEALGDDDVEDQW